MVNQMWSQDCTKGFQKHCAAVQGADSGATYQIHLFPAWMWGANANTWASGFLHLGAAQVHVWVLGARRTSICSRRSDKQLEGVTLYFHHGQTHQLLSFPLKFLAHTTDNCPCSLVRSCFSFWRQSPICTRLQLSTVDYKSFTDLLRLYRDKATSWYDLRLDSFNGIYI